MNAPSIEALLSRKGAISYPIAKRLNPIPGVGSLARAWVRAHRESIPRALWAPLPPLSA